MWILLQARSCPYTNPRGLEMNNSSRDVVEISMRPVDSITKERAKDILGINLRDDTAAERELGIGMHLLDNGPAVFPELSPDYERLTTPGRSNKWG
jgi:hypothetical protein